MATMEHDPNMQSIFRVSGTDSQQIMILNSNTLNEKETCRNQLDPTEWFR